MQQGYTKPILVFMAGASGSGKTTVLAKLLPKLKNYGLTPAIIKHACHLELNDKKDSTLYLEHGAPYVSVISPEVVLQLTASKQELALEKLLEEYDKNPNIDFILVEGYKNTKLPKIEVMRQGIQPQLYANPQELLAVVTDMPEAVPSGIPVFDFQAESALAEFIWQWYQEQVRK